VSVSVVDGLEVVDVQQEQSEGMTTRPMFVISLADICVSLQRCVEEKASQALSSAGGANEPEDALAGILGDRLS